MPMPMMRRDWPDKYMLIDHTPVACGDAMSWAQYMEDRYKQEQATGVDPWRVGSDMIDERCHVSTVFMGLDHRFFGDGEPVLFETMIFGGPLDQEQYRYCTWAEAERGHAGHVERARTAIAQVGEIWDNAHRK